MSKLVSSVQLKKADGKPITINFQFENGLPMKSIENVDYVVGKTKETGELMIVCYFKDNQNYTESELNIKDMSIFKKENGTSDLWIHFETFYIIINTTDEYLTMLSTGSTYFQLYDNQKNLLKNLCNQVA